MDRSDAVVCTKTPKSMCADIADNMTFARAIIYLFSTVCNKGLKSVVSLISMLDICSCGLVKNRVKRTRASCFDQPAISDLSHLITSNRTLILLAGHTIWHIKYDSCMIFGCSKAIYEIVNQVTV